jgi:hypothetical protein
MYDALSCFSVVKNAVSVFVQSGENISLLDERSFDSNFVLYEKGFYDLLAPTGYRRSCLVTATPIDLAVAARFKEVFLSLAFLLGAHLPLLFQMRR